MTRHLIILFLFFNGTALFGQSFSTSEWAVISLNILNEHSDNIRLRKESKVDSLTIVRLEQAYYAGDSALKNCQDALHHQQALTIDNAALLYQEKLQTGTLKKEVSKQKRIKWLMFGGMILFLGLSASH